MKKIFSYKKVKQTSFVLQELMKKENMGCNNPPERNNERTFLTFLKTFFIDIKVKRKRKVYKAIKGNILSTWLRCTICQTQ